MMTMNHEVVTLLSWELLLCAWTYFRKPVCWKASETEIRVFSNLSTNETFWKRFTCTKVRLCAKKVLCFYQYSSLGAVTKIYILSAYILSKHGRFTTTLMLQSLPAKVYVLFKLYHLFSGVKACIWHSNPQAYI